MDCDKMGALIQRLRREKGYTQKALADMLNISDRTVSKWERGGVHIVKDTTIKTHAYDASNNQILEVKPYEMPYILRLQHGQLLC